MEMERQMNEGDIQPKSLPIYQVDAFADTLFAGNPAAVVPLERWLPDAVLQAIAMENNLSETAFVVKLADADAADYHIRWFTPTLEVPLCGHATLATAYVLFKQLRIQADVLRLQSQSGILTVKCVNDQIELDFPSQKISPENAPDGIVSALGAGDPVECYRVQSRDTDLVMVYNDAATIRAMTPEMPALAKLSGHGVIVTAPSDTEEFDMVSRYFAPAIGIEEDPVTGYMHCVVAPYWADKTGKAQVVGYQASRRGGVVDCRVEGDRVFLRGTAVLYLTGQIFVPSEER